MYSLTDEWQPLRTLSWIFRYIASETEMFIVLLINYFLTNHSIPIADTKGELICRTVLSSISYGESGFLFVRKQSVGCPQAVRGLFGDPSGRITRYRRTTCTSFLCPIPAYSKKKCHIVPQRVQAVLHRRHNVSHSGRECQMFLLWANSFADVRLRLSRKNLYSLA